MTPKEELYKNPLEYIIHQHILSYDKYYFDKHKERLNEVTQNKNPKPPSFNFITDSIAEQMDILNIYLELGFSYTVKLEESKKCYDISISWDSQEPINNLIKYYE